jgi:hypothetical protein
METIKYVDEANKSIRNFYEKTKFQKVSELLLILNSAFDEKLKKIKVFENKYAQIENTKGVFMSSLVKIIVSRLEDKLSEMFEKLEMFLERLETDPNALFILEFILHDAEQMKNLMKEFSKFGEKEDLYQILNTNLKENLRRHNKRILEKTAVMTCFRKPNLRLLNGYKKILSVRITSTCFCFLLP